MLKMERRRFPKETPNISFTLMPVGVSVKEVLRSFFKSDRSLLLNSECIFSLHKRRNIAAGLNKDDDVNYNVDYG